MKNLISLALNTFFFIFLYLNFQKTYECIKINNRQNNVNHENIILKEKNNMLSSYGNIKGHDFMDHLKNEDLKNKGVLNDMKDELAEELANKIHKNIESYLKEESSEDIGNLTEENLYVLKNYAKNVSEYVGLKASDLLDESLEEALKPLLSKKAYDDFGEALKDENIDTLESSEGKENNKNLKEETEKFVDNLVNDNENGEIDEILKEEKEIKLHGDQDHNI